MNESECKSCGYKWLRRISTPRKCPNCQSRWWAGKPSHVIDKRARFQPPTSEEVKAHFSAKGWDLVDGKGFFAWQSSKGWPGVVDWKMAALAWMARVEKEAAR